MVPIANNRGLDAFASHMVPNFYLATATTFEEIDGRAVLLAAQVIHLVILLDHGFLRVAQTVAQTHQNEAKEGLVSLLRLISIHFLA